MQQFPASHRRRSRSSESGRTQGEELFDYERELGVSAQTVWGLKKTVFNGIDFGAIVATTYAAAH